MTRNETRAKAYLERVYARYPRLIVVNPEGHEPGFYHEVHPDLGAPYLTKRACLATLRDGTDVLVDVTGDEDEIICTLED